MTIKDKLAGLMQATQVNGHPISALELGKRIGKDQSTISRILNGETTSPRKEIVEKLANFFGITPAEMRDEGTPPARPIQPLPAIPKGAADNNPYLQWLLEDEARLISCYRTMDSDQKKALETMAAALVPKPKSGT